MSFSSLAGKPESEAALTLPEQKRIDIDFVTLESVLERTSTLTDFSSMLAVLHAGPKQRGTERKEFRFTDSTKGDVYRCVLLAMKADPPDWPSRTTTCFAERRPYARVRVPWARVLRKL
jgi:hypothetical protein